MNVFRKIKRYLDVHYSFNKNPTERIISFWNEEGADFDYFKQADQQAWLDGFWKEDTIFYRWFQQLNLQRTLEIACGTGRHSLQVIDKIGHLYLLDSSKKALEIARDKFKSYSNVSFIHNASGMGLPSDSLADASLTSVFSYDAMVHFEKECVFSYVKDTYRVLQPGGLALLHHSNYDKNPGGKFTDNPGWRNYMTQELFIQFSKDTGFEILQSEIISYSCDNSDCITLLKKPV
jgi:ubiquinone/menaquinone biosynthesis C-methylase UbiE